MPVGKCVTIENSMQPETETKPHCVAVLGFLGFAQNTEGCGLSALVRIIYSRI